MFETPPEIPFGNIIEALLDESTPVNPRYLYRLSDLEGRELEQLQEIWPRLGLQRRQALLEDLEEMANKDTLLSYDAVGRLALDDEDPRARTLALQLLWETEDVELVRPYLNLMAKDPDATVRAAAAGILGRFVYLGEVEEISPILLRIIEEQLLAVVNGPDTSAVRRRAFESLGFSGRPEVTRLIQKYAAADDKEWLASAVFAMGRSANDEWVPTVLEMLHHPYGAVRAEAARAAGELEIGEALPDLVQLLKDDDDNTRMAAIWSLSQLGGEGVRGVLEALHKNTEDEDEANLIEEALENLTFTDDLRLFEVFDIPDDSIEPGLDGDEDLIDLLDEDVDEEFGDDGFEDDEL